MSEHPSHPEHSDAETLRALSDIDLGILRLQKQLDELPHKQQILEVRHRIRELEAKDAQVQKMAQEGARTLTLLTDEMAHDERTMAEAQRTMNASSEYREAQTLAKELEMLSRHKAKLEDDSLLMMEKQEKIAGVAAQVAETAKKLAAEEQAYTNAYRKAGGRLKQEVFDLEQARKALVASLPHKLASSYLSALEHKAGIGAVYLRGNRCSGCFATMGEGQLAKLAEGPVISACPSCNRPMVTVEVAGWQHHQTETTVLPHE